MKLSKKLRKIDRTIAVAGLVSTGIYAIVRGILELTHKLPKETEDESGIEVEVYEDTSESGVEAENEPDLPEDTVGEVDESEVVNFEEN